MTQVVKELSTLGMRGSILAVENAPTTVMSAVSADEATVAKAKFTAVGATVEVR